MKRVILSALAAGIFATAAAQEELTLRKCLEIGLENNYDIRIVRNEERISDNNATAANAGMVPTIDFEAGYSGALDNERTTPREGDAWSDNGIYDQTFNAGINLNWTIFDGFRIRTNYKKLKEMQEMGTVRTRITIEDFVASLTAEYYNYVQQTLRLQNFRYAVALSRERLRITEARVSVGNFSRLDLLQARVDFNADSSKYMSQQELVSASRIRINELLANKDVNEMLCIRDSVIEVNGELKWEELLAQTLDTNASLLLAGHDNVLAELDLKTVQARNYPYLNLTTGYGYTYNRFGNGTTQSRGTLGLNAGVKLGITIFDGNRRREQRNARIDVENAQLTRERLEQSLRANLSNFWQAYRNNLEVIQLEKENLIAAKENYEIAMERYLLGDLPGIEMREAQKSLLDAEIQYEGLRNIVAADQRQRHDLHGINPRFIISRLGASENGRRGNRRTAACNSRRQGCTPCEDDAVAVDHADSGGQVPLAKQGCPACITPGTLSYPTCPGPARTSLPVTNRYACRMHPPHRRACPRRVTKPYVFFHPY